MLASSGDDAVSKAIVQRLDLPDTAPSGVEWSPFLRGFPHEDRYVLSRTFRDTGASRGGMVFSHALLAPLDEIGEISDLGPFLNVLAVSDHQRPDAVTLQIVGMESGIPDAEDLTEAAEALGTKAKLPVVRLGHVGFDDLVVALWANVSPEIRRGFAFRLSFDPRDLVETPIPALVCTPRGMEARWSEYPVIRSTGRRKPGSLAGAMLRGHEEAAPLVEFMNAMGVRPATFSELRLAEQAYCLDIGEQTFERRVGTVRLIGKLSPDVDAGEEGKNGLVRRLCDLLSVARADEVLRLRNLELAAFTTPNRVWKALERWVARNSFPPDQDTEMFSVLEDATAGTSAVSEWRSAVLAGLAAATGSPRNSFPRAFWRWLQKQPEIALTVFGHVPAEAGAEERLARATPRNLDEEVATRLATVALSRRWLCLHGAVMSAICPALDAARRQVAVDTDLSFVEGLRWALRYAKGAELMECALEMEDPRMPRLAGEAAAKEPRLLAEVDLTAIKAQVIWRESLIIDPETWRGPADPIAAFHSVLDGLLNGGETDTLLVERLSDSAVGDLGTYPRRSKIWSRIGDIARHHLLVRTAKGWLGQAVSVGIPFVPEHELQVAILEDEEFEERLDALIPNDIGTVVRIVTALSRYDDHRFLRLLEGLLSRIALVETADAEAIGRLVLERRWGDVTADLVERYRDGRRDLKPALRACCDLIDVWDRFFLRVAPVSEWEKWKGFEELAVQLYPGGPDERELWERAGGDNADLSTWGDGRSRWRRAAREVRNGREPRASALLAAMMEDFPKNDRIAHLASVVSRKYARIPLASHRHARTCPDLFRVSGHLVALGETGVSSWMAGTSPAMT